MKLYKEDGYINQEKIINRAGDVFIFEIGGRGIGKTYSIMQEILKLPAGRRFLYMRRTQREANMVSSLTNPFKALMNDNPDLNITYATVAEDLGGFFRDDELIGYAAALSTFYKVRGVDFSDVDVIYYDEFIPEKSARPLKDEYGAFQNAHETVNRNRELQGKEAVKFICSANSNDIANPIFIGMECVNRIAKMANKSIEEFHIPERKASIYMFMKSPIAEKKMETALYKFTAGQKYQEMAIRNMFDIDTRSVASRNLLEYKPVCQFGELVIYKHKSRSEYYAACHASGTVPVKYSTRDNDKKRFIRKYNNLYINYLAGNFLFEDETSMVLFEKIFA